MRSSLASMFPFTAWVGFSSLPASLLSVSASWASADGRLLFCARARTLTRCFTAPRLRMVDGVSSSLVRLGSCSPARRPMDTSYICHSNLSQGPVRFVAVCVRYLHGRAAQILISELGFLEWPAQWRQLSSEKPCNDRQQERKKKHNACYIFDRAFQSLTVILFCFPLRLCASAVAV